MQDLVSIITPSYNSSKFICETIESVLSQTYRNWEMIIVDDCSTDNSLEIINEYIIKDNRIQLIKLTKNSGPAIARNTGIKNAKGKYIAFIDSDDLWLPQKLEKQIRFMIEKDIVFSFTAYQKINEEGNIISDIIKVPKTINYEQLLFSCVIGCLTVIYDCLVIGKSYMPNIKKAQDYGLWLNILKKGFNAHGLNENLALYRVRKNSISYNKFKKTFYQWKIYRNVEKLPFSRSLYYMLNYAYHGYKKYKT